MVGRLIFSFASTKYQFDHPVSSINPGIFDKRWMTGTKDDPTRVSTVSRIFTPPSVEPYCIVPVSYRLRADIRLDEIVRVAKALWEVKVVEYGSR